MNTNSPGTICRHCQAMNTYWGVLNGQHECKSVRVSACVRQSKRMTAERNNVSAVRSAGGRTERNEGEGGECGWVRGWEHSEPKSIKKSKSFNHRDILPYPEYPMAINERDSRPLPRRERGLTVLVCHERSSRPSRELASRGDHDETDLPATVKPPKPMAILLRTKSVFG